MTRRHGLWLNFCEGQDADAVERAIQENGTFTMAVPSATKPRIAEIAIVSVTGQSVDYIGVARGGPRIVTGQKRIAVARLLHIRRLPVGTLKAAMPKRFQARDLCGDGANRLSPSLWEELLAAIARLRPDVANHIPVLKRLVFDCEARKIRREGGIEVFERDAVASAIQVFGGAKLRKRVLRSAEPLGDDLPATFLASLGQISLREDPQILHDSATFPGLVLAKRYLVGAVELENERGERLTILNCNRQPLEKTLGVDLVYYAHAFDSFVMIQYKRMTKQSADTVAYRPSADKNYEAELARMVKADALLAAHASERCSRLSDFRLSSQPLFFKLCESRAKAALDEGMVSGMYIPLPLWRQFMNSKNARGRRGGVLIGWKNAPRHLSNSEFTALLRRGWIGSSGCQSKLLSEIIEAVLGSDHMLVLAATSSSSYGRDYLRDSYGRFAEEDEPLAAR